MDVEQWRTSWRIVCLCSRGGIHTRGQSHGSAETPSQACSKRIFCPFVAEARVMYRSTGGIHSRPDGDTNTRKRRRFRLFY
jgi:hypothetical protein